MLCLVLLSSVVSLSSAIVCTPELCLWTQQTELNCKGSVIEKGGFCGCTDICALVEDEGCELSAGFLGLSRVPPTPCDDGLECVAEANAVHRKMFGVSGKCQQVEPEMQERAAMSDCESTRRLRMISMAIWEGQWTPKCNLDGSYQPLQCDNTDHCFCVDKLGKVMEETKRLGLVHCE